MRAFRKFLSVSEDDRRLLVLSILLLPTPRIALPVASLIRVLALSGRIARSRPYQHRTQLKFHRVAWALSAVCRRIPLLDYCLSVAMAAKLIPVLHGHPSELRIGVTKGCQGRLGAHAWLESGGRAVVGSVDLARYSPLPCFDGTDL